MYTDVCATGHCVCTIGMSDISYSINIAINKERNCSVIRVISTLITSPNTVVLKLGIKNYMYNNSFVFFSFILLVNNKF